MKTPETTFDQKRRSFLKLSGVLGLGVATAAILPAEKAEAMLFGRKEFKVTKTKLAMGTFVAITAIHPSRDEAEMAIGLAFEEIDRLSGLLTHYDPASPVGSFNTTGKIADFPEEMGELIARSMYYHQRTGGAFDITVKPLIDLYKNSASAGRKPSEAEVTRTLSLVGSNKLAYRNGVLQFDADHMAITLDGIAKGYIVDKASAVLNTNRVGNHLINAGGDIRTSGLAAQGKPWTVAIQDPEKKKEYPDIVSMGDGAIATSGSYEIFYDKEKVFHHIVDGRNGLSPQLASSVTVIAPTVMDADAMATTVFVMGPRIGVDFINQLSDYRCLVLASDGSVAQSRNWKA